MQGIQPGIRHSSLSQIASSLSGGSTAALGEAVRDGNVVRMRDLLKQGADPEQIEPGNTAISAPADELLLAARKINHLLPRETPARPLPDFEAALRDYDLPRARQLLGDVLKKYPPDLNPAAAAIQLWGRAGQQGYAAILNAMLVLGDDKLADYRPGEGGELTIMDALSTKERGELNRVLHYPLENAGMRHSALRDYLKQFPYYSTKTEPQDVAKLNCKTTFKDKSEEKIACRHLVFAWLLQLCDQDGKPDYARLKNVEQLQEIIPYEVDEKYAAFQARAQEVHMVANKAWGGFAAEQFRQIEAGMEQGRPSVRRMLANSSDHAMAVEFKIKEKDGRKSYVQNFYDPNLTNVHKRLRSDGMHCHEAHSLDQLLYPRMYDLYYGKIDTVSLVYVVPDSGIDAALSAAVPSGRRLSSSLDGLDLDASVLYHLLTRGFDADLEQIKNRLIEDIRQRPDQAATLLAAKNDGGGRCGFLSALHAGHANAVKIFAGIILQSGLNAEQQVELLAAKTTAKTPGLFFALQTNKADTVRAFVESILQSNLETTQKVELLGARGAKGTPGLFQAFKNNKANAVQAFVESVLQSNLETTQKVELLDAKNSDRTPSLLIALEIGHADAVQAFVESVLQSNLEATQKVELLGAKNSDKTPGLFMALQNGHADAVRTFADSVLQSNLEKKQKVKLVAAKLSNGAPGLSIALWKDRADTVRSFMESICRSPLTDAQKIALLAAKDNEGKPPGILEAEPEGHPNAAVAAYREAIQQLLTPEQQALLKA